jgi:hypothetical protein
MADMARDAAAAHGNKEPVIVHVPAPVAPPPHDDSALRLEMERRMANMEQRMKDENDRRASDLRVRRGHVSDPEPRTRVCR